MWVFYKLDKKNAVQETSQANKRSGQMRWTNDEI